MPAKSWTMRVLRHSDILIAAAVIFMVVMMVVPLPPMLLDLLLSVNLTGALVILLLTMYTGQPLEFSVFPSLLLVTTLFRLALNVSSTRLILLQGYAGQVIQRLGEFVVGGNPVVGFVVFCILVVIQFIVITRGAERVAEVAARFTLDAMPGKQMSIDADLNAGLITEGEARARRRDIEREADFYGAMDGASKFVKGDAIAAVIITVINLIGGFCVGVLGRGLSFQQALEQYALLTVGDGLVCQIPALLISTATGIVVTRAASETNMGREVTGQILSQPRVLAVAAGLLFVLSLIPGLPRLPFFLLAGMSGGLAYTLQRSAREATKEREAQARREEQERLRQPENVFSLLQVDPLEVELGYGLVGLAGGAEGGDLLERVVMIRRQLALDLGLVLPPVRIRDNMSLPPNTYVVKLKGVKVASGELMADRLLAMSPGGAEAPLEGLATREPAFGMEALWITPQQRVQAEAAGYTVVDPASVMATHLVEVIKAHAHELLSRQDTRKLLDAVKASNPAVVEDLVPEILTLGEVQAVLQNLLAERVPIRDLVTILETLGDRARATKDPDLLTEYVRQSLSRAITARFAEGGCIKALVTAPEVEEEILKAIKVTDRGSYLALAPEAAEGLSRSLARNLERVTGQGLDPIVLCSAGVRPYLRRLVARAFARVAVLSYPELEPHVRIESLGVVRLRED
ncbi:MAG: flagellar biosynthesis protein FlhA [Acetobacteraceae bacterium]|nr:flagellar biosynthesis protein FlhA [Acetobacteraceae bacterium]